MANNNELDRLLGLLNRGERPKVQIPLANTNEINNDIEEKKQLLNTDTPISNPVNQSDDSQDPGLVPETSVNTRDYIGEEKQEELLSRPSEKDLPRLTDSAPKSPQQDSGSMDRTSQLDRLISEYRAKLEQSQGMTGAAIADALATLSNISNLDQPGGVQIQPQAIANIAQQQAQTRKRLEDLVLAKEKLASSGVSSRPFQQSRYVKKSTGTPLSFDPNQGTYFDPFTGEKVDPKDVERSRRPRFIKDPFTGEYREVEEVTQPKEKRDKEDKKSFFQTLNPKQRDEFKDVRKSFNKDTKEERKTISSMATVSAMIEKGLENPAALGAMKASLARAFESGRLTDEDVERYARRAGIWNRFIDAKEEFLKGTITPEKARDLMDIAQTLEESSKKAMTQKATTFGSQFASDYNFDTNQVVDSMIPRIDPVDVPGTEIEEKDETIQKYADQYNLKYEQAEKILRKRGYGRK